jgi:hypothetical protein
MGLWSYPEKRKHRTSNTEFRFRAAALDVERWALNSKCRMSALSSRFSRFAASVSYCLRSQPQRGSLTALLCHLILDDADDGHEDRAADATAPNIGQDALHIHSAAARGCGTHYGLQNGAAEATADNSCNLIPNRTQTFFFHGGAGDIAADRTADRFDNQASDIHRFWFLMLFCVLSAEQFRWNFSAVF